MVRRPPRSTRSDTLFPYPSLFRSYLFSSSHAGKVRAGEDPSLPARPRGCEKGNEVCAFAGIFDAGIAHAGARHGAPRIGQETVEAFPVPHDAGLAQGRRVAPEAVDGAGRAADEAAVLRPCAVAPERMAGLAALVDGGAAPRIAQRVAALRRRRGRRSHRRGGRSEEHTSELQSLMRTSYAVFCLKKNKKLYLQTENHKTR